MRADGAIVDAVLGVLGEVGFTGLTIEAVAQRAGVGKATIYRRWAGKEQLVLEALNVGHIEVPDPDTGGLRSDLIEFLLPLTDEETQQGTIRLMPALAAQAVVDPQIALPLRRFVADRRNPLAQIIERGRARGEVGPDVDIELAVDLLTGPILYRLCFSGLPVDLEFIQDLIDRSLRAIAP